MKNKLTGYFHRFREIRPKWLNLQNLIFVVVILAFVVIVVWSETLSVYFQARSGQQAVVLLTPTTLPGTATPLPEEWLSSPQQTNGIISGAIIILATIITGTAAILIRDRGK